VQGAGRCGAEMASTTPESCSVKTLTQARYRFEGGGRPERSMPKHATLLVAQTRVDLSAQSFDGKRC
jgi:hypothetical protein